MSKGVFFIRIKDKLSFPTIYDIKNEEFGINW